MKFLAYDGPLATAIRKGFELFVLNICLCLCCIPVVTAGAAVTALYGIFMSKEKSEEPISGFFTEFRRNFRQATAIWLVLLAVGAMLGSAWLAVLLAEFPGRGLVRILLILCTTLYASVSGFALALQARYENSLKQTLRNAMVFGTVGIVNGMLSAMVCFLPVIVFFMAIDLMPLVLSFWIPLGGALSCKISAWLFASVFRQIEGMMQSAPETEKSDMPKHV